MSEVKKHLSIPKAHLEAREGSRADARNYCMSLTWKGKSKRRAGGPYEIGNWINDVIGSVKPRESHAETAITCLLQGMKPHQVAASHPVAFFTHAYKIIQTHEALETAVRAGIFDYSQEEE